MTVRFVLQQLISNNTPINGTINIGTDEDWYAFNAASAGKLTVTLDNIPTGCDYDVAIYDVNNNILSGSHFTGNNSEKTDIFVDIGNYYVRVYSYTGSSQSVYSLNVNLSTPDQYEVNDSVSAAKEVFVDSSTFGTIDNIKDLDYFEVNIEETENYIFELQNIPTGKDYDLTLYNSLGNVVASSWNSSNTDELMNISLNSGCYYIKIHSYSGFSWEQKYLLSAYRQNALTLSMPYIRANAGETVSVPIGIQNIPTGGLCSFNFKVDYDETALNYLGYTVDYSDSSWALEDVEQVIEVNKECDGVIKVLFLDNSATFTKPLNKVGIIIKLNFQVNTIATDGVYEINYSYGSFAKDLGDTVIDVSHVLFKNGLIMTGSYGLTSLQTDVWVQNLTPMSTNPLRYGDLDGDSNVNAIDFAHYRKYLLGIVYGFPGKTPYPAATAADVNRDGGTNAIDFGYVRKFLLGMIGYFPGLDYTEPVNTMLWNNGVEAARKKQDVIDAITKGNMNATLGSVMVLSWFKDKVKAGAEWDLKTESSWKAELPGLPYLGEDEVEFLVFDEWWTSADLGNVNYGYAGQKLGLSEYTLLLEAGVAQLQKDYGYDIATAHAVAVSRGESGCYGDQRDDFLNIRYGYEWAGRH